MAIADVQTKLTEAAAAIELGDYATAKRKALAAQALLMGIPDSRSGDKELRFFRSQITGLIDQCIKAGNTSAGISFANVTYTGPSS